MKNQTPKKLQRWTDMQLYIAVAAALLVGGVIGYLLHGSESPAASTTAASSSTAPESASLPPSTLTSMPMQNLDAQAKPLLARLETNPKDVSALNELGNLYFDASQYATAIGYYTRSLNEAPTNPDVRTDLGICYYYTGDPDRALKEFDRALKDDPRHVQTLFNVGVVKAGGKNDPKGAIAAWESLLKIDPAYRDRAKVESMLNEARAKVK